MHPEQTRVAREFCKQNHQDDHDIFFKTVRGKLCGY